MALLIVHLGSDFLKNLDNVNSQVRLCEQSAKLAESLRTDQPTFRANFDLIVYVHLDGHNWDENCSSMRESTAVQTATTVSSTNRPRFA